MDAKLITQAEFARQLGVTKGAIYLADKRNLAHIDPETRKIDTEHPLNVAYKKNNRERTSDRQKAANLSKSIAKELSTPDGLKELLKEALLEITSEKTAKSAEPEAEKKSPPSSEPKTSSETNTATPASDQESRPQSFNPNPGNKLKDYDPKVLKAAIQEKGQKAALENLKIQEKQMKIAELSGELARRDHVETFIGIIAGTISNYFLPLDFRLTATIMDICGINDPKIKLEISEAIAKETTAGLAQVKQKAEEFALSLNPALS